MSALTRDEQRVVRRIGGWKIAHLLAAPDAWSTDYFGRSHFDAIGDDRDWLECSASEIKVGMLGAFRFSLKWSRVKAHARSLPADLRERIATNNRAHQKHQAAYPRFAASAPACGHGRPVTWFGKEGPITQGQALYAAEYDAWEASGVMDLWRAEGDVLDAERSRLLDEALPLAADDEPADLLELLEALA
jgi:hypothetical protein